MAIWAIVIILLIIFFMMLQMLVDVDVDVDDIIIGKTHGVYAYKNKEKDSKREKNFIKNVYTGLKWECVEFVRRFLLLSKNFSFNEIDHAYQLWYDFNKIMFFSKDKFMFIQVPRSDFMYNSFKTGDILVWASSDDSNDKMPYGHMAIIVSNVDDKYYKIAEQNWEDVWESDDYSRIIDIFTEPFLLGIIKIR